MARGTPSTEQLLELLKRAAEELKSVRASGDAAAAALQAELEKEKAAHQTARRGLEGQGVAGADVQKTAELEAVTDRLNEALDHERARALEAEESLAKVVRERDMVQGQYDTVQADRDALRIKISELEVGGRDSANLLNQIAEAQVSAEAAKVAAQAREAELEAAHTKDLDEREQRTIEAEAKLRTELGLERAAAIDAEHDKTAEAEAALAQEREKLQDTAKKLLEARSKVRELETTVASEQERLHGLEAAATGMADQHQQALDDAGEQHAKALREAVEQQNKAVSALQDQVADTQRQLTDATENWRHVERQYEQLHREMLQILEQRDEARSQLEAERTERRRLERGLGTA